MHDAAALTSPTDEPPPQTRRGALCLLALLLAAPILASCKDVKPGSGVETIRSSRSHTSVSGK